MNKNRVAGSLVLTAAFIGATAIACGPDVAAQPVKSDIPSFRIHYKDTETAIKECAKTVQETGRAAAFNNGSMVCATIPPHIIPSDLPLSIKNPVLAWELSEASKIRKDAEICFRLPHRRMIYTPQTGGCAYFVQPQS